MELRQKIAQERDFNLINDFLIEHFNDHEPIQLFHVRNDEVMDVPPSKLLIESIEARTSVLAYYADKLVDVAIASEISSDAADKKIEYAKGLVTKKGIDIFELSAYVSRKANHCISFNFLSCLHVHMLSELPST